MEVSFKFTINKSFLGGNNYPITVPKRVWEQLRDSRILSEGDRIRTARQVKIIKSGGTSINGLLYHGKSGYGLYYQIRIPTDNCPQGYFSNCLIGNTLDIAIGKNESQHIYVTIRHQG